MRARQRVRDMPFILLPTPNADDGTYTLNYVTLREFGVESYVTRIQKKDWDGIILKDASIMFDKWVVHQECARSEVVKRLIVPDNAIPADYVLTSILRELPFLTHVTFGDMSRISDDLFDIAMLFPPPHLQNFEVVEGTFSEKKLKILVERCAGCRLVFLPMTN